MTFINTAFLWALPLAAIPVVIYYLMRFRSLRVRWGANYVLQRALARLRKNLYLKQLLLVALRVLICVFVALAFARPVSRESAAKVSGTDIHHVIILDASMSMLAEQGHGTLWESAVESASAVAATWGRGERWSLLVAGENTRWVVQNAAIGTGLDPAESMAELEPEECAVSMYQVLNTVFSECGQDEKTEVCIFADDQATTWAGAEKAAWPDSDAISVYWCCPPLADRHNLAVTRAQLGHDIALAGHPTRFFAEIVNTGISPAVDADVELLVDGSFHRADVVSIQPGQTEKIAFDITFESPGSHVVTVRTPGDAIPADNAMAAAVRVKTDLKILALRDPGTDGKFDTCSEYLGMLANAMTRTDDYDSPLFRGAGIRVSVHDGQLMPADLDQVDVIVLDGGRTLSSELVTTLAGYVSSGGGLLLSVDEATDATRWNELLGPADLLPASIGASHTLPLDSSECRSASRSGFQSDALRVFETVDAGDITVLRFFSWRDIGELAPGSRILVTYARGEPLVVGRRTEQGLGNVLLVGSGLRGRTNNMLAREVAYPWTIHLLTEAASGCLYPLTLQRRQPVQLLVSDRASVRGVTFGLEGRPAKAVTVRDMPNGAGVASMQEGCRRSGPASMLVLRDGGSERTWFGIQGTCPDSDLHPVDENSIARMTESTGMVAVGSQQELNEALLAGRRGRELHAWLIGVLLLALVGEMVLQRSFA